MKLEGRRKSDNFEDITKQKPKMTLGLQNTQTPAGMMAIPMRKKAVQSKKKADGRVVDSESMKNKTGLYGMERAAASDTITNRNRQIAKEKDLADEKALADRINAGSTPFPQPTELKENWTPRPLKK